MNLNQNTQISTQENAFKNVILNIWVNISLGNGLLPESTNPLPEPVFDFPLVGFSCIHSKPISQSVPKLIYIFCIMRLKNILLKLPPYLPGANEWTKLNKH